MRQVLPERIIDYAKAIIFELLRFLALAFTFQHLQNLLRVPQNRIYKIPSPIWMNSTAGASVFFAACNQALFWMVRDVCCKDRIHPTNEPISTCHFDTI